MTTPKRPALTDEELGATLRAWMEPGPRSLSEPAIARVRAEVHATRQVPAWRAARGLGRGIQALRLAGAALIVFVAVAVVAWAARGSGRPVGVGGLVSSPATSPLAGAPSPSPSPTPIPSPSPTPRATPVVTGDTLGGVVAATGATYQVRYPQLGGLAEPAAGAAINKLIRDQADAAVLDFTSGIGKDPQAGPNQPSTLQLDFSVAYSSPDLLSLRVNSYAYPSGAAHGSDVLSTFTFDLASGRQLALADLFRPGSSYLDALATEARTQLRVTLADWMTDSSMTQWLATGTEPTADNYAAWAVTPGGLEITFGQYQVAPYAAGMPVVTIPVTHLAGLIDPTSPLAPLADSPLPAVTITLGIYSGRPDPTWTLTDVEVAALVGQLASLPVANGVPSQGGLGYHGFSMLVHEVGRADQTIVAYRGAVTTPDDAPGSYRADPQRTVEQALLQTGRSHLAATEASVVEADLTRQ
jgi:hypothetical protein